ncbi:MAG: aromatic ring-hydroxylating dioxygenase subunit alpha [Gammaproteobacteria bacterium]|nr:aromatic ring-hydroxylating dioxygenase subunit alpha [Gammaproteobacteria bacterium]
MATMADWQIQGSAYDRPEPHFATDLSDVARGTPTGEMLRRYWHPIAVADEIGDLPQAIKALGEDLVLFKTPGGEFGLVYPRCIHRGTELIYGKVEDRGIRCCYHGWLFDCEGRCLERPCEPPELQAAPAHYRQPWYPVEEKYGLVFAYLGPLELKPNLPSYDILENVEEGMRLVADGTSIGSGGPDLMPCNWFQTHENVMDPFHVFVLHSNFSTQQFGEMMSILPKVNFATTEHGVISEQIRPYPDGSTLSRITEVILPNLRIVADPTLTRLGPGDNISWTLPLDETSTRIFTAIKWPEGEDFPWLNGRPMYNGKTWFDLSDEEHQRYPGDYEAQVSQGNITFHSEEHLASSDKGVALFRRKFRQAIQDVLDGKDPEGICRGDDGIVHVRTGNFVISGET